MGKDMPYIYHITGYVSAIIPGMVEYMLTGQLTPLIAGGAGVAGGLLTFAILVWWHNRKTASVAPSATTDQGYVATVPYSLFSYYRDKLVIMRNPGNHEVVSRLIVKAESIGKIDSLFSNYINSASHHQAYELDVAMVHYVRKCQLLEDAQELTRWYQAENIEIRRRYGLTRQQFNEARERAEAKYPELKKKWRINQISDK